MKQNLLFVFLISCLCTQAQSYHNLISAGFFAAGNHAQMQEKSIIQLYCKASLPLKLKNNDYFLINPDIHTQEFSFNEQILCRKFGSGFAYMHMRKNGNLIALLNVSNNASAGNSDFNSMQYGAGILVNSKVNTNLKLKYGLYGNREFFGVLLVPLIGIDYKMNNKWRLFGIMPQNMKLEYKVSPKYRTGIAFEAPLNTYRLHDNKYLDQRQIFLSNFNEFYLGKNLLVQVQFRLPVSNSQRIFANDQVYDWNVWGEGQGGRRADVPGDKLRLKHGPGIDINLNYRLEIE